MSGLVSGLARGATTVAVDDVVAAPGEHATGIAEVVLTLS
jgi:hypothetical protein